MDGDILLFFDRRPAALPLYGALEEKILSQIEDLRVKVQKTQISFSNRRLFACASFLGVRRAKDRPEPFLVITFGLDHRVDSPRPHLLPGGGGRGAGGLGPGGRPVFRREAVSIRRAL